MRLNFPLLFGLVIFVILITLLFSNGDPALSGFFQILISIPLLVIATILVFFRQTRDLAMTLVYAFGLLIIIGLFFCSTGDGIDPFLQLAN